MLLTRLADERGVALPVALAVVFVVAGLATVAARGGIVSQNQSFRDKNAKRAIQASNAGLQAAVYQTNLLQPGTGKCVVKDASTGALSSANVTSGWCATQTEDLGDGATWQMQISDAGSATYSSTGVPIIRRTVVSTGIVNGVRRRSTLTLNAATGTPVFPPGYTVVVRDSADMKNNSVINGHIGSNGTITFKNNTTLCGNGTPGPGKTVKYGSNFSQCAGYNLTAAQEPFDLQPVDLAKATPNHNDRLTNLNSAGKDTCSNCNKISWSATTRVLTIDGNGVLNMGGDETKPYFLCRLDLKSGGKIQIPSRTAPLYIYIDRPENCGGTSGMGSVNLAGDIVNLYSPAHALGILVAGSSTKSTVVTLSTNTDNTSPVGIYAPSSTVSQMNNVTFTGAIVAKTLTLQNNAEFTWDPAISGLVGSDNIRFYQAATGSYKECTSAPGTSTPSDGC